MRKKRTIYFNDARHYYLFVFEPPMRMEDAWLPVDEVAGTAIDTFSYGVSRGDGLFYPSKTGSMFGHDLQPFQHAYEWRSWHNMQSLIERGLDPLQVLIDRAHEKGMDFIASLRLGSYGGMDPAHSVANGGRGFVHDEVRNHQQGIVKELATDYPVEAVELDFSAAPGGSPFCLQPDDVEEYMPVMTEFVRAAADIVRGRTGEPGQIGARVYPTEEMNLRAGLDVSSWLQEGLVDFVVPMLYLDFVLDSNMPIRWLVESVHKADTSIYGMLQPYCSDESRRFTIPVNATPSMMAAASVNFWNADVDGLCTWFLSWPLGDTERRILSDIGDPDLIAEADKHYFVRRNCEAADDFQYEAHLPLEISSPSSEPNRVPFHVGDDTTNPRIAKMILILNVTNLVTGDRLGVSLNGESLGDPTARTWARTQDPYAAQRLEYLLEDVKVRKGDNELAFALEGRAEGMEGAITIEDVEVKIEYGGYPKQNQV